MDTTGVSGSICRCRRLMTTFDGAGHLNLPEQSAIDCKLLSRRYYQGITNCRELVGTFIAYRCI